MKLYVNIRGHTVPILAIIRKKGLKHLDVRRAKQILNDRNKIEVVFQDKPVWIEDVKGETANVTVMGTCKTMNVSVASLSEPNKVEEK